MISRRGLIAGSAGMGMTGRGGQTPRRPDQVTSPPPGVVIAPGGRNVIRARTVIVFGTGNGVGVFQYSGVPALGNPPVAYEAPPGVTKDPFGNTLPSSAGGFTAVKAGTFFANMSLGAISFTTLSGSSFVSAGGGVQFDDALATGTQPDVRVLSPITTGGVNRATVWVLGESNDTTKPAQVVINTISSPSPSTTALLEVQGTIQTTALAAIIANGNLQTQLGDIIASAGNLLINTIGKGLRVKEGSGAKQGTVLLSGGTATVNNANVTAASRIFLTAQDNLSTGALRVSSRVAGTSFTITSSVAGDSGSVAWEIFEPA